MGFFDRFRRRTTIDSRPALADFIDAQAAFLAQKGVYEYARARAGVYSNILFSEKPFLDAVDRARWEAYPLALTMVGEMIQGVLRSVPGGDLAKAPDGLVDVVLSVFDRHPVPAAVGEAAWTRAREELSRWLRGALVRPPKLVKDISEPFAGSYFALMPIHERLRGEDFPTLRNYLRVTLVNIHDELVARMDGPALAADLCGAPA